MVSNLTPCTRCKGCRVSLFLSLRSTSRRYIFCISRCCQFCCTLLIFPCQSFGQKDNRHIDKIIIIRSTCTPLDTRMPVFAVSIFSKSLLLSQKEQKQNPKAFFLSNFFLFQRNFLLETTTTTRKHLRCKNNNYTTTTDLLFVDNNLSLFFNKNFVQKSFPLQTQSLKK